MEHNYDGVDENITSENDGKFAMTTLTGSRTAMALRREIGEQVKWG